MSYPNGLGGRHDLGILCALGSVGPEPVTARELALMVATSAGSVAPALRSLVKGGSCSGIGENSGQSGPTRSQTQGASTSRFDETPRRSPRKTLL